MSTGGTVAAGAARRAGQPHLVERCHLNQFGQFNPLHHELSDPVPAMYHDRRHRIEVDQSNLDLATIARIDRPRTVDDRKTYPRSETRSGMHQTHHSERDRHRDPGGHQGTAAGTEFDIDGAVEVDAGIALMGTAGQRQPTIQANNRKTGRHEAEDYS